MSRAFPLLALFATLLVVPSTRAGQEKYTEPSLKPADREHWAFVPPKRPEVPKVGGAAANPIDAFIQKRLSDNGLSPSPSAEKLTLIRRVTLDLTGLPPAPADVDAFLKDTSKDAYEKVVNRLLASPQFGERWAQHWLDVVRFAETNGYEADGERPHAWRYRDYAVKSFNDDKPYDQFVTEQIAGDLLFAGKGEKATEALVATGMHRCGPIHVVGGNLDADVLRQERFTEIVNGVGSAFLGLTVGCARCHDHKFDPFSAGDYYRLQAFFANTSDSDVPIATPAEKQSHEKATTALNAKIAPLKAQVAAIDSPYRDRIGKEKREKLEPKYKEALDTPSDKRTAEQRKLATQTGVLLKVTWEDVLAALTPADRAKRTALREQIHELEARMPAPAPAVWGIETAEKPRETFVLKRGDVKRRTTAVTPGFPRVLAASTEKPADRVALAKWLTSPEHPLTARVIVNRLWQHHFGTGVVNTPNDFGVRGDKPTHPELLDWLACELVESKWSLKHIHRLIVTSATYRQDARTQHGAKADPENKLLWRMNRQRLEAEAVRDSILIAAGTLNPQVGGPSVKVPLEPEVYDLIFTEAEPDGLWPVTPDATQHTRRSLYLFNKRNVRLPMLEALDQPDTLNSCAFRPVSTYAPQALILMNGPFVQEQGKSLALKLAKEMGSDPAKQIDALYRRAVGRAPRPEELKLLTEFVAEQSATIRERIKKKLPVGIDAKALPEGADLAQVRALADLCVVVFNSHEFVFRP